MYLDHSIWHSQHQQSEQFYELLAFLGKLKEPTKHLLGTDLLNTEINWIMDMMCLETYDGKL